MKLASLEPLTPGFVDGLEERISRDPWEWPKEELNPIDDGHPGTDATEPASWKRKSWKICPWMRRKILVMLIWTSTPK